MATKQFQPKIIIFDLETLPDLQQALKYWTQLSQYPGKTMRATVTTAICGGWKIYGKKQVHCINAWDYSRWDKNVSDDYSVVKALAAVLKDADAVVTYNGINFDWKYLQTRLLVHGLKPLPRIAHIDCCQLARSNMYFINNRLGTVGETLVNEKKLKHSGWDLWVDVYNKVPKAMAKMTAYCKQDVLLLEKVFTVLKPFARNIPNHNLFTEDGTVQVCPSCGNERLRINGYRHTATRSYTRLRCGKCGASSRTDTYGRTPRNI